MRRKLYLWLFTVVAMAGICGWGITHHLFNTPSVQAQATYSNASLKGTYGFTLEGTNGTIPLVGCGSFTALGNGVASGIYSIRSANSIVYTRKFNGAYTVNADGSGVLTMNLLETGDDESATANFLFMIVEDKRALQALQTDPGRAVLASFQMQ